MRRQSHTHDPAQVATTSMCKSVRWLIRISPRASPSPTGGGVYPHPCRGVGSSESRSFTNVPSLVTDVLGQREAAHLAYGKGAIACVVCGGVLVKGGTPTSLDMNSDRSPRA